MTTPEEAYDDYLRHLKQEAPQRMKDWRRKNGEIVGKDWLWLIPAFALVAYLIAYLVKSL